LQPQLEERVGVTEEEELRGLSAKWRERRTTIEARPQFPTPRKSRY
jgi:hypothetical protein